MDPLEKRRAEFFTKLITDAFSPSNFLTTNPAALRALMDSKGESLVKGMQNFAADVERGGGKLSISQAWTGKIGTATVYLEVGATVVEVGTNFGFGTPAGSQLHQRSSSTARWRR
jgi:poly(3-hydroxyalkanoate) synthetase